MQASALTEACIRQRNAEQALQAHAIRMAVWGDPEGFGDFCARLNGDARQTVVDDSARDAALAAFRLRAE